MGGLQLKLCLGTLSARVAQERLRAIGLRFRQWHRVLARLYFFCLLFV